MKSNVEIIQDMVEQVINQKKIDLWDEYTSQDYISRVAPYVGTGYSIDTSGNKNIIHNILPGSPAEEKLQVGDEVLWEEDEHQHLATNEDIKRGVMQGPRGSKLKIGVRRGNQTLEYELTRDLIKGFDTPKDQAKLYLRVFLTKQFPDVKATIKHILADGDMVVCLLEYHGYSVDFKQDAVWSEAQFLRLSEGKIVEEWSILDGISFFKQLGYQIILPST